METAIKDGFKLVGNGSVSWAVVSPKGEKVSFDVELILNAENQPCGYDFQCYGHELINIEKTGLAYKDLAARLPELNELGLATILINNKAV